MPRYKYEGFADVFKTDEDDKGTKKGDIGTFSKAMVDKYAQQGHIFTPVEELQTNAVKQSDVQNVAPADAKK